MEAVSRAPRSYGLREELGEPKGSAVGQLGRANEEGRPLLPYFDDRYWARAADRA